MTHKRYLECLAHISCSRRGMSKYLHISGRTGRRFINGDRAVPPNLLEWLEMLVAAPDWRAALEQHPYPKDWKEDARKPEVWDTNETDDDWADDDDADGDDDGALGALPLD